MQKRIKSILKRKKLCTVKTQHAGNLWCEKKGNKGYTELFIFNKNEPNNDKEDHKDIYIHTVAALWCILADLMLFITICHDVPLVAAANPCTLSMAVPAMPAFG